MCAKFQGSLTPSTGFLAIDMTFLTNILGNHFSRNIFAVFYHSEFKFSNLNPNWAKNRPLLSKTLYVSNCVDSGIVQWLKIIWGCCSWIRLLNGWWFRHLWHLFCTFSGTFQITFLWGNTFYAGEGALWGKINLRNTSNICHVWGR